jgi:transposase-like protein
MPPSRTVAPYSPPRTHHSPDAAPRHGRHPPPFIPVTNPLERFNREIGRRTDVVGIFPNDPSLIRLVSMLAIEANNEWLVGRSYISQRSMQALYDKQTDTTLSSRSQEEVAELAAA